MKKILIASILLACTLVGHAQDNLSTNVLPAATASHGASVASAFAATYSCNQATLSGCASACYKLSGGNPSAAGNCLNACVVKYCH